MLEHITPFHLRHLPLLPPCRLSSSPIEYQHQLAFAQRHANCIVHVRMRLYNIGRWRNALPTLFQRTMQGSVQHAAAHHTAAQGWHDMQ